MLSESNAPESLPEGSWLEHQVNEPFAVVGKAGIYRYRYSIQDASGETTVVLFGGRRPAHTLEARPDSLRPVAPQDMEMVRIASQRGQLLLDTTITVTLLAWDVNRPKAKVIKASGAVLTVCKDRLQLPQGDQINESHTMDARAGNPEPHSPDWTRHDP